MGKSEGAGAVPPRLVHFARTQGAARGRPGGGPRHARGQPAPTAGFGPSLSTTAAGRNSGPAAQDSPRAPSIVGRPQLRRAYPEGRIVPPAQTRGAAGYLDGGRALSRRAPSGTLRARAPQAQQSESRRPLCPLEAVYSP